MAKYTQSQVEKIITSINSSFAVEAEYVNNITPLLLRHSKCGKTFERNINSFKKSQKCPNCEGGRNNWNTNRVADYINGHTNSEYCLVGEYTHYKSYISILHKKCGHEYKVTFDGIQHFRGWGSSKEDLENIKRRDKIKNDYCKKKNIPLVRITYREYSNIETKVKEAIDWIRQQNMHGQ